MRVKAGTEGKTKDVEVINVTPENYIVPKGEEHLVHAVIEVRKFDADSGKRISIPRIQKFGVKSWRTSVETNLKKQGYTITMLHDPAEWLAEQEHDAKVKAEQRAAKAAEDAEAKAKADAKAEEERRAAEKAALKAEILAELKDAGVIPAAPVKGDKAKTGAGTEKAGK